VVLTWPGRGDWRGAQSGAFHQQEVEQRLQTAADNLSEPAASALASADLDPALRGAHRPSSDGPPGCA
jgi:hypothetical protein